MTKSKSRYYHSPSKTWKPLKEFPRLQALCLWLEDEAPCGPSFGKADYCWLDVAQPIAGRLTCAVHGPEIFLDGNDDMICRWCHRLGSDHKAT